MSFCEFQCKLSHLAKVEKSIVVRENDKNVREIDIHLTEILRLIDPVDFAPALTSHSGSITNVRTSAKEKGVNVGNL